MYGTILVIHDIAQNMNKVQIEIFIIFPNGNYMFIEY